MWNALTAIGTLLSALVIAVTVIMAAKQVRLTQEQVRATNRNLEQLQRATQLDGVMEIFRELAAPPVAESGHFIRTQLVAKMKDPGFLKHGLIDPSVVFGVAHPLVTTLWEIAEQSGYLEMRRKAVG